MKELNLIEKKPKIKRYVNGLPIYDGFNTPLSDETINEIIRMYKEGKTQFEISIETDYQQSFISKVINTFAPQLAKGERIKRYRGWDKKERYRLYKRMQRYYEKYEKGKITLNQIAKKLNISYWAAKKYYGFYKQGKLEVRRR